MVTPQVKAEVFPGYYEKFKQEETRLTQAQQKGQLLLDQQQLLGQQAQTEKAQELQMLGGAISLGGDASALVGRQLAQKYTGTVSKQQQFVEANQEILLQQREMSRASWRLDWLKLLPDAINNPDISLKTVEDIKRARPNYQVDVADEQFLTTLLGEVIRSQPVTYQGKDTSAGQLQQLGGALQAQPAIRLGTSTQIRVNRGSMTTQQLLAGISRGLQPQLDPQIDIAQMRQQLTDMGNNTETIDAIMAQTTTGQSVQTLLAGRNGEDAKALLWRQKFEEGSQLGFSSADERQLYLSGAMSAGALIMWPFEKYETLFFRSYMGMLIDNTPQKGTIAGDILASNPIGGLLQSLLQHDDIAWNQRMETAKLGGANQWQAWEEAALGWEANGFRRLMADLILDPLNAVGTTSFTAPLKSMGRVGHSIHALNVGYARGMDSAFRFVGSELLVKPLGTAISRGGNLVEGHLGKTIRQVGNAEARAFVDVLMPAISRKMGQLYTQIAPAEFGIFLRESFDRLIAEPHAFDPPANVARFLISGKTIVAEHLNELVSQLDGKPANWAVDVDMLSAVNNIKDKTYHMATDNFIEPQAAAHEILVATNMDTGIPNQLRVTKWLEKWRDDNIDTILNLIKPSKSAIGTTWRLMKYIQDDIVSQAEGAIANRRYQDGILRAQLWNIEKIARMALINGLERNIVQPFARAVLIFPMYGWSNVLEVVGKTRLAGHNPIFRGDPFRGNEIRSNGLVGHWPIQTLSRGEQALQMNLPTIVEAAVADGRILTREESYRFRLRYDNNMTQIVTGSWIGKLPGPTRFRTAADLWGVTAAQKLVSSQMANYIGQSYDKLLMEEVGGEAAESIAKVIDLAFADIPLTNAKWLSSAKQTLRALMMTGDPQLVRDYITNFNITKIDASTISDMIDQYPEIAHEARLLLMPLANSGTMFNKGRVGINNIMDIQRQMVFERYLRGMEFYNVNLNELFNPMQQGGTRLNSAQRIRDQSILVNTPPARYVSDDRFSDGFSVLSSTVGDLHLATESATDAISAADETIWRSIATIEDGEIRYNSYAKWLEQDFEPHLNSSIKLLEESYKALRELHTALTKISPANVQANVRGNSLASYKKLIDLLDEKLESLRQMTHIRNSIDETYLQRRPSGTPTREVPLVSRAYTKDELISAGAPAAHTIEEQKRIISNIENSRLSEEDYLRNIRRAINTLQSDDPQRTAEEISDFLNLDLGNTDSEALVILRKEETIQVNRLDSMTQRAAKAQIILDEETLAAMERGLAKLGRNTPSSQTIPGVTPEPHHGMLYVPEAQRTEKFWFELADIANRRFKDAQRGLLKLDGEIAKAGHEIDTLIGPFSQQPRQLIGGISRRILTRQYIVRNINIASYLGVATTPNSVDIGLLWGYDADRNSGILSSLVYTPQLMALKKFDNFASFIRARVEALSNQTADSLGWTVDSLRPVYDSLTNAYTGNIGKQGLSAKGAQAENQLAPILSQLENMRQEIIRYGENRGNIFSIDMEEEMKRRFQPRQSGGQPVKLYDFKLPETTDAIKVGNRGATISFGTPYKTAFERVRIIDYEVVGLKEGGRDIYDVTSASGEEYSLEITQKGSMEHLNADFLRQVKTTSRSIDDIAAELSELQSEERIISRELRDAQLSNIDEFEIELLQGQLDDIVESRRLLEREYEGIEDIIPPYRDVSLIAPTEQQLNSREIKEILWGISQKYPQTKTVSGTRMTQGHRTVVQRFDLTKFHKTTPLQQEDSWFEQLLTDNKLEFLHNGDAAYQLKRQKSVAGARQAYQADFPDWENENIIKRTLQVFLPYIGYELHRPIWLAREALKHPATMPHLESYRDSTENGHVHIPGTPADIRPLGGTIYMNGMAGLFKKDYPEMYDQFKGVANISQQASKYGFWLGEPYNMFMSIFGSQNPHNQLGSVIPQNYNTLMGGLKVAFPKNKQIQWFERQFFPDSWRDYLHTTHIADIGGDGATTAAKIYRGEKLTLDEQNQWNAVTPKTVFWEMIHDLTGIISYSSQEKRQLRQQINLIIEEETGIPTRVVEQLHSNQKKFEDVFGFPLPQAALDRIRELEAYHRYTGIADILGPSQLADQAATTKIFWSEVIQIGEEKKSELLQVEDRMRIVNSQGQPQADINDFNRKTKENSASMRTVIDTKQADPRYAEVNVRLKDRIAYAVETNQAVPSYSFLEEMKALFFDDELTETYDWDTGQHDLDFQSYYARQDYMIRSIPEERRAEFEQFLSKNQTPMQQLKGQKYRELLNPYYNIYDLVLADFTPEQQKLIKQFQKEADPTKRDKLKQEQMLPTASGELKSVITIFDGKLGLARKNYRLFDPETDAWLTFFNPKMNYQSSQAELRGIEIRKSLSMPYGTPVARQALSVAVP